GDCVDCRACVAVCPTGIDIRDGPQLECITCALCIDACNEVMGKLGRPADLIGYSTLRRDGKESRGEPLEPMWKTFVRPRTLLYFALWAGIGIAMLVVLAGRQSLGITVAQDRNPLMVTMADGSLRNGYTVKILNKAARPRDVVVTLEGLPEARLWESLGAGAPSTAFRATVRPDGVETYRIFVRVPAGRLAAEHTPFTFRVTSVEDPGGRPEVAEADARFTVVRR
ncbi:MAG: FixG Ig-like domain-containing protein, partial [Thermaurantiacus tibetensis]